MRGLGLLLLGATPAAAQEIAIQVLAGVGGSAEADDLRRPSGPSEALTSSDLDGELGLEGRIDTELSPDLWAGVRLAYLTADAGDGSVSALDAGLTVRLVFPQRTVDLYALVGAGLSFLTVEEALGRPETFDGTGWHCLLGGGLQVPITDTLRVLAGLAWYRQAGDLKAEEGLALSGLVAHRLLLMGGVSF